MRECEMYHEHGGVWLVVDVVVASNLHHVVLDQRLLRSLSTQSVDHLTEMYIVRYIFKDMEVTVV